MTYYGRRVPSTTKPVAQAIENAWSQDAYYIPRWFVDSMKQQCAALPPVHGVATHRGISLIYKQWVLVVRSMDDSTQGAASDKYHLSIPGGGPCTYYTLPDQAAELSALLNKL